MTEHDTSARTVDTLAIPDGPQAVSFNVPGKPVGKGRPRAAKRGKHITLYTPGKTVSYESTVAVVAMQAMAGRPLIAGPVNVVMKIDLSVPASWSNRKRDAALAGTLIPTTKPDIDNVIKTVFDAINGVVWVDDTQVANLYAIKRYSSVPGVQVAVHTTEAS